MSPVEENKEGVRAEDNNSSKYMTSDLECGYFEFQSATICMYYQYMHVLPIYACINTNKLTVAISTGKLPMAQNLIKSINPGSKIKQIANKRKQLMLMLRNDVTKLCN